MTVYPGPTGLTCPTCGRPATHAVWFGLDFTLPDGEPREPDWYGCEAHALTKAGEPREPRDIFEQERPIVTELDDDTVALILDGLDA